MVKALIKPLAILWLWALVSFFPTVGFAANLGSFSYDCSVAGGTTVNLFGVAGDTFTVTALANPGGFDCTQYTAGPSGVNGVSPFVVYRRWPGTTTTFTLSGADGSFFLYSTFPQHESQIFIYVRSLSPSSQNATGQVNSPLTASSALTANRYTSAPTYSISPALPAGLSLNTSTGVVSGTPSVAQAATGLYDYRHQRHRNGQCHLEFDGDWTVVIANKSNGQRPSQCRADGDQYAECQQLHQCADLQHQPSPASGLELEHQHRGDLGHTDGRTQHDQPHYSRPPAELRPPRRR